MTNGENIRAMSDEQLSIFLSRITLNCFDLGTGSANDVCFGCPMHSACRNSSSYASIGNWLREEAFT